MRAIEAPNLNHAWSRLVIDELVRLGVSAFVLSPGSRSTPLTMAVANHPRAPHMMHFDERGAAFYALGRAKAAGKPAVLICTSGSAAANYWPAVVEASETGIPLVLLTADRPPELLGRGANQAIDQAHLFGNYARAYHAIPCPDTAVPAANLLTTVDAAYAAATAADAGPVHMNCPFREPLAPDPDNTDLKQWLAPIDAWCDSDDAFTMLERTRVEFDSETERRLLEMAQHVEKGVLLLGELKHGFDREMARKLAGALGWPVITDYMSGLHTGVVLPHGVPYYDQLLLSDRFRKQFRPDFILHLGGRIISKRLQQHLKAVRPTYLHVDGNPRPIDPNHQVTHRIVHEVGAFCAWLLPMVRGRNFPKWPVDAPALSRRVSEMLSQSLPATGRLTEPAVAHMLSKERPEGSLLFAGNSMPVRDLDMYACEDGPAGIDMGSRGASGIDGNLATAIGMSDELGLPGTAVVGDLTALHDLNSLALLRGIGRAFVVVVINNDGGGIFHFLPIAKHQEKFEPYFGTPHGLHFGDAAEMFGLEYAAPRSLDSLRDEYNHAMEDGHPMLIEVRTNRSENTGAHRALHEKIVKEVEAAMDAAR